MRNLCTSLDRHCRLTLAVSGRVVSVTSDPVSDTSYLLLSTGTLVGLNPVNNSIVTDVVLPPLSGESVWIQAQYIAELEGVCCVASSGDIVVVDLESAEVDKIGDVDGGIIRMAWSPDQETVAFISASNKLVAMTSQWQVLAELMIEPLAPGFSADIYWRGDGQYLVSTWVPRDAPPTNVALAAMTAHDESDAPKSPNTDHIRVVKVWSQNLELRGVGRPEDNSLLFGLTGPICWSPNNSLIATTQVVREALQVVFFETNGQRHREFTLHGMNSIDHQVLDLAWNSEADVLAVLVGARGSSTDGSSGMRPETKQVVEEMEGAFGSGVKSTTWSTLQLYHRDNCHWYLKQEHRMGQQPGEEPAADGTQSWLHSAHAIDLAWDLEKPYLLHLAMTGSTPGAQNASGCRRLEFAWRYDTSDSAQTTAGVLAAEGLQLTPLALSMVPPPMAYTTIPLTAPLHSIAFDHVADQTAGRFGAGLAADGYLRVWSVDLNDPQSEAARSGVFRIGEGSQDGGSLFLGALRPVDGAPVDPRGLRQLVWLLSRTLDTDVYEFTFAAIEAVASEGGCPEDRLVVWSVQAHGQYVPESGFAMKLQASTLKVSARPLPKAVIAICRGGMVAPPVAAARDVEPEADDEIAGDATAVDSQSFAVARAACIVQLVDGAVMSVSLDASAGAAAVTTADLFTLPQPCEVMAVLVDGRAMGSDTTASQAVLVARSQHSSKLYANDRLLAPSTGSFAVHPAFGYLLFITLGPTPTLAFSSLDSILGVLNDGSGSLSQLAADNVSYDSKCQRAVERGARIVAVTAGGMDVVLQMPRGNLEGVCPRVLGLAVCRRLMDDQEYGQAVELMRRHRIDMNLLVDHDPAGFRENLPKMVQQIRRHDRWDLVISALDNEDVTESKYQRPPWYQQQRAAMGSKPATVLYALGPDAFGAANCKVNTVCQWIEAAFAEHAPNALLLSRLAGFARRQPPALDQALRLIQQVAEQEGAGAVEHKTAWGKAITAERSLKQLIVLSHVDRLYDVALGMYDLELVTLIAQRSQKDPREYLPFLAELRRRQPLQMRFAINMFLKRWSHALSNAIDIAQSLPEPTLTSQINALDLGANVTELSEIPPLSVDDHGLVIVDHSNIVWYRQIVKLVHQHGLHSHALAAIKRADQPALHRVISISFGDALFAKKLYSDALVMFTSVQPVAYEDAIAAAEMSGDWRRAVALKGQSGAARAELQAFARELAESMRRDTKADGMRAAAELYLRYLDDPEEAVVILCENMGFAEAIEICVNAGRLDLIQTNVIAAAQAAAVATQEAVEARQADFVKAAESLRDCRTRRLAMPMHMLLGVPEGQEEQAWRDDDGASSVWTDASSIAGSVAGGSVVSGISGLSSASSSSSRSTRTAGDFSHLSALSMPSMMFETESRATQQKQHKDFEKIMKKREQRRERKGKRHRRSNRFSPGSNQEEDHWTREMNQALPTDSLLDEVTELCLALATLQQHEAAAALCMAYNNYVNTVVSLPPLPETIAFPAKPDGSPLFADRPACDLHSNARFKKALSSVHFAV